MTVEFQLVSSEMVQIVPGLDLSTIGEVKAIFVTTNIAPSALLSPSGSVLPRADSERCEDGMRDLSLAGCCEVQTTAGGLRISSSAPSWATISSAVEEEARAQRQRKTELSKFRARKYRQYFSM